MPLTRLVLFAQSVIDYGGLSVRTAFSDAAYSVESWFRGSPRTAWGIIIGMVLLAFLLRKKRRRY